MASSKPKLVYFNAKGRAEPIRLIFAAAGVDYEDFRFEREQWPEMKKKAPTGVAPWLEAPEGNLVQSPAIARYFARKYELLGKSDWEYYLVERALAQIEDIQTEAMKAMFAPEEKKAELMKEFQAGKGKALMTALAGFLKDGGDSGLFAPSGLTLADLTCLHLLTQMSDVAKIPDFVSQFPQLVALVETVKSKYPKVADWLKKRPDTKI